MIKRAPHRQQKVAVHSLPAPVGGWNARDSVDEIPDDDAIVLDNLYPGFGKVSTRRGFTEHADELGGSVMTLAEFNAGATRKLLAAADGHIWDVSSAGAGSSLDSGFAEDRWQWAQFDDASGGARMGFVNGADAPQFFNGSAIAAMTVSGTGLTVANLDGINVFKSRTYFWDSRTQDFWYSEVGALGGTLTKFPLGRVHGTGGNLTFMATWTRDGGAGADDLAVFAMSSGDVLIYAGSNPGDAADWSLVGHFKVGAPLSIRGYQKVGGDLWVMTKGGYIPLGPVLAAGEVREKDFALSSKIRGAVAEMVERYSANFGWQAILYPRHSLGSCAIFNVPLSATQFEQHVINTATGAWCRWKGLNARCWGLFNDRLYFGGDGVVYLADNGFSDAGAGIMFDGQTAWSYLKRRGQLKQLTLLRLLGSSTGAIDYSLDLGSDFKVLAQHGTGATSAQGAGGEWDTSDWDVTDWPAEVLPFDSWHSVGELGYNFSARIRFNSSASAMDWYSLAFGYQGGGVF